MIIIIKKNKMCQVLSKQNIFEKKQEGFIISPESPGLGIEFDEELARENSYSGTSLHLEMQEDPCNYKNNY